MSEWAVRSAIAARLGARRAQLPDEAVWQHLEGITDFGHLVQSARSTPLAPWVEHLGPQPDPHQIEAGLREGLLTTLDQVRLWQPLAWRPATRWCRLLPQLPAIQHLLAGGEPEGWMERYADLQPLLAGTVRQRRDQALGSALAPLVEAWDAGLPVWQGWSRRWQALWPVKGRAARPLQRFLARAQHHRELLLNPPPNGPESPSERFRRAAEALSREQRRSPRHAVASFAYLARVALDHQRLRGLLLHRRLMPQAEVPA